MIKNAVIDLSHWNTVPESLVPARQAGVLGVIHKATEGQFTYDSKVEARRHLAEEAGMLWGLYHFLRPGDMHDQAKFFCDVARSVSDENTLFAADYEDSEVSLDALANFLLNVHMEIERAPVLYSGHVLKEKLGGAADPRLSYYRLWLAQYGSNPELPPGFDAYWLWQYTDQGEVPGIKPPTDLNTFMGSESQLRKSWAGHDQFEPDMFKPGPEPEKHEVEILIRAPLDVAVSVTFDPPRG